jgi:hypothetical protein
MGVSTPHHATGMCRSTLRTRQGTRAWCARIAGEDACPTCESANWAPSQSGEYAVYVHNKEVREIGNEPLHTGEKKNIEQSGIEEREILGTSLPGGVYCLHVSPPPLTPPVMSYLGRSPPPPLLRIPSPGNLHI